MINLVEVYEISQVAKHASNLKQSYSLREVYVNPSCVVCLKEVSFIFDRLDKDQLPEGLDHRQKFTRVHLNHGHTGMALIVVGAPLNIAEKLNITRNKNAN